MQFSGRTAQTRHGGVRYRKPCIPESSRRSHGPFAPACPKGRCRVVRLVSRMYSGDNAGTTPCRLLVSICPLNSSCTKITTFTALSMLRRYWRPCYRKRTLRMSSSSSGGKFSWYSSLPIQCVHRTVNRRQGGHFHLVCPDAFHQHLSRGVTDRNRELE